MTRPSALFATLFIGLACVAAHARQAPVTVEIVDAQGRIFADFPVRARDGAQRSYLQAERGARYEVRVRNTGGERVGLVIAVDGRNIINGRRSELARGEPMYVLDAWDTQRYAGWRASLDAINEFYFTDFSDSYAEAFGDRSAKGVIAVAVYREVPPPEPVYSPRDEESRARSSADAAASAPSANRAAEKSAGTGYGDRRTDLVVEVDFVARAAADSRHFIKYEWRETLCRKKIVDCGESNRFWDESALGFAPPPRRVFNNRE
jgi:hypothetical protein